MDRSQGADSRSETLKRGHGNWLGLDIMIVFKRLAETKIAESRGEPKGSRFCSRVVPPVERVEEKRNEGHSDGRRAEGRVQAEMQVQLQIRCSFP